MRQEDIPAKDKRNSRFSNLLRKMLGSSAQVPEEDAQAGTSPAFDNVSPAVVDSLATALPTPPAAEDAPESPRSPSMDSALFRLWDFWCTKSPGTAEQPLLSLSLPADLDSPLFTAGQLSFEQRSFERKIEKLAAERLPLPGMEDATYANAHCFVHVSASEMAAWFYLLPPIGDGQHLTVEELITVLAGEQINYGIDYDQLGLLETTPRYFVPLPIALGTAVVPGKNGHLKEYFQRYHVRTVEMDENGNVDYRAQAYTQNIRKGEVLCDILPPETGINGCTILGKALTAAAPAPAAVPAGTNTNVSEDGSQLLSTMDGHVIFSNNVYHVKPLLDIPGDVDYSSGNINFKGDVHVRGNVRENFTIVATGTITIDGMVEASIIEAGGDIIISSGVLGDHKAVIKSKKNVRAKYLESCVVYSGECTYADCIISSQVYSDNRISVLTGRGTVIGGSLTAANRIDASVIGSKAGRRTDIRLGVFPYIHEEYVDNQTALGILQNELTELKKRISYFEEHQNTDKNAKTLSDIRLQKSVLSLKISKLGKRQEEIDSKSPDLSQCRLECGTVFPITNVYIGSASELIDTLSKKCVAVYDSREHTLRFL